MQGPVLDTLGSRPHLRSITPSQQKALASTSGRTPAGIRARHARRHRSNVAQTSSLASVVPTVQEIEEASTNGNGAAVQHPVAQDFKSDLEVDSVLAKELEDNGRRAPRKTPSTLS